MTSDGQTHLGGPAGSALAGIRVVDFTATIPGPLTTRILAQLGAEVWKVEPPDGDVARQMSFHDFLNSGKRSVGLDLRSDTGRVAAHALVAASDVLVEGFRPGVMARFGLAYDDLAAARPDLVYCSISGFGQTGPRRRDPCHDINLMALSGLLNRHRDESGRLVEASLPAPFADITAGLLAAIGILAAVAERSRSGRGRFVDISLLDASALLGFVGHATWAETGVDDGQPPLVDCPHFTVYRTSDGRAISLGIAWHESRFWKTLCMTIGVEALAELSVAERMSRQDELRSTLAQIFARSPLATWVELLTGVEVPWAPLNDSGEASADPQLAARPLPGLPGATVPIGVGLNPTWVAALGQHNAALEQLIADTTAAEGAET
jgi:crotonobetainyl-CoA:carnitine CoA-transferase CaiB-like acyl-CoA transferase